MSTERGMIFKNNPILYSIAFIFVMGVGFYIFFKIHLAGILVFLTGLGGLIFYLLFTTLSISVSRLGISKHSIVKSWNFGWSDITGWNVVTVSSNDSWRRTIWFRTGANIYKIDPSVLKKGDLERLQAYFERYYGKQTEGESRLRQTLFQL